MSATNSVAHKSIVTLAVGAGFLIGAAGLYIYQLLVQRKKLKTLQQHLAKLDLTVSDLHQEFSLLRKSKHLSSSKSSLSSRATKRSNSFSSSKSGYVTADDMFSTVNTDDDDEFYDINSDDEILIQSLSDSYDNKNSNTDLFNEVDSLMKGSDEDRRNAFNILKKHEFELAENVEFLWRFAKAHQLMAGIYGAEKDMDSKKKYIFEGLEYAAKAIAMDDTNPDAHKWFAILTGMQGDFVSIKEKIQNGYEFQKHLQFALEKKPNDYSLHYLLARFKYEVANISWIEKKIASSIFAEVPNVTFAEAISDLLMSEKLNPSPWKESKLLLAKCYIGDGKYDKAIQWLDSAKEILPTTKEDEACDEEINNLIEKYKKYRK